MAKKKKMSFKGKVKDNAERSSKGNNYNYYHLPDGMDEYKPTPGEVEMFDIVPYVVQSAVHTDRNEDTETAIEGTPWYKRPFRVHRNVGASNETKVCPTSFGKKCPICEYRQKRQKEGADKDELEQYYTSQRTLYYVIPRGVDGCNEKVHLFDFSHHNFQKQLFQELNEEEKYENFPLLDEDGYTLKVRWAEEKFGINKYAKANRIDFKSKQEEIDEDFMDGLADLDTLFIVDSYKSLKKLFMEGDIGEDESDEKSGKNPFKGVDNTNLSWDDLADMDMMEICDVIENESLEVDTDEHDNVKSLRKAVASKMGIKKPKKKLKK